jgi:hypothetical protein
MGRLVKVLAAATAVALFMATPVEANFGIKDFSVVAHNENGSAATLAGSHPFGVTTTFNFNTREESGETVPDGTVKSLRFEFPPGFIGSTTAVPRCTTADFLTIDGATGFPECPNATAVGVAWAQIINFGQVLTEPVYNLVPPPGVAVKLGFAADGIPITTEIGIDGDAPNGVVASAVNVPSQLAPVFGASLQVWGVPAAESHDPFRGRCLAINGGGYGELISNGICDTDLAEEPFLTLPRSCTGPLVTSVESVSWEGPEAAPDKDSFEMPEMTRCSDLGFLPEITAKPTSTAAESASGLELGIDINDENLTNPAGRAQSDIKDLTVRMPAGMTVNPSAANGLVVCPRAGYEAESLASAPGEGCPQASKIGELEAESRLLPEGEVQRGSVFLASQDDNPFGSLVALYVVVKNPELGILVKRAIKVEPSEEQGPNAGQIVTTTHDIPQIPISHLRFRFNQGARAPLVTPPACGTYATEAQFTPWANPGNPFPVLAPFEVTLGVNGSPCPSGGVPPFLPGFSAGSINNNAGAYSAFDMRLTRADGEQNMTRFDAVLPKGMTGKLAGITKCPDSAIAVAKAKTGRQELATPSCPATSEIGRTLVGAGVGSVLTYVPGKLYLSGPFAGAPLSVIAITPAVAGPFDVGTVVVHEALTVDPETAEVKVDGARSDPIPHLLRGIPVKLRDLRVYADRPNFTLNPTSCAKKEAKATLFGSFLNVFSPADDVPVSLADRYQAASCASLKFRPNLSLKLKGGTRRGDHPKVRAVVSYPQGADYANTRKAVVTFPHSAFLEQAHIRTVCTRVQFRANQCPAGSIYGKARAFTPLLDEPLEGPVYLRSSSNPLPDLVLAVRGVIDFNAVARVDSVDASIRVNFDSVPDAPLSKVIVEIQGGKKGLIVNSRNLCAHESRAKAAFTAHNGKTYQQTPVVKASCGKAQKSKRG